MSRTEVTNKVSAQRNNNIITLIINSDSTAFRAKRRSNRLTAIEGKSTAPIDGSMILTGKRNPKGKGRAVPDSDAILDPGLQRGLSILEASQLAVWHAAEEWKLYKQGELGSSIDWMTQAIMVKRFSPAIFLEFKL